MRKELSNKEFYNWLKKNKICPGCKNALSDYGFVKCSICRYNDRSYNKNRNRKDYHNDYYQKNKSKILERCKNEYKDKRSEYMKKYYQENKEILKMKSKKYKMKVNGGTKRTRLNKKGLDNENKKII